MEQLEILREEIIWRIDDLKNNEHENKLVILELTRVLVRIQGMILEKLNK